MKTDWGLVAIGTTLEALTQLLAESTRLSGRLRVIAAICQEEQDRDKALLAIARIAATALADD